MTQVNSFDLLNSPLSGSNLIEASAGTGKTYAITGLFLRLLVERNLSLNEILIVTFTEAATQELKDRIRSKLRQAVKAFSGERGEDNFLNDLAQRNKESGTALIALKEALRGFDQAAIFTIHGFCRRMLHENAFESGSLFDTELITDLQNLKQEIGDDFWRKHFYKASSLFVRYAMENKFSPARLLSLFGGRTAQPYLEIIPLVEIPDCSQQEKEFKASLDEVRNNWQSARAEVEEILTANEGLSRVKYRRDRIPVWVRDMDGYVASPGYNPILFKGFEKFTTSELKASVKKGQSPPSHPFFELCEILKQRQGELENIFEQRLLGLKAGLFHYVEVELARRKEEKNLQSFDDLLLKLHRALGGRGGEGLARAVRGKFRAALIDEFQDTDPIQYDIFNKIFSTKDRILFLIGDPKQAIYGFRGADIFAYMKAAEDVKFRHTLSENWRSEPDLITATNTIFSRADRPFIYEKILFQPAAPATRKPLELLSMDKELEPPLQLWFLGSGEVTEPGKTINKGQAREVITRAVAAEISRLLGLGRDGRALLGKRPLTEGDIAVLVRTNAEARLIQEALSAIRVPCVLYSTGNLFDSHEALETERVLRGIMDPNNERRVKVALATDMMGVSGEELDGLIEDESAWEKWLAGFNMYHGLWNERGFVRMFRYLLSQEKVLPRLMSLPDGERRSTNLLHLGEVLHQISVERKLGMAGIAKWLSEQRDPDTLRSEEHQLRLESDENAVKLVTIHKSKGLEYPVVFCPFAWDGSKIKKSKEPFVFHNEADNMTLTLDLGSDERDKNRQLAEKELLAENLRLLYVALTRARNRCYLAWGRFNEAETSALAYLLHQPESLEQGDVVNAIGRRFKGLDDEDVVTELRSVQDKSSGAIRLSKMPLMRAEEYLPVPGREVSLRCLDFSGNIDRQWRISSFSSLVSGLPHDDEIADRDAISLPDACEQQALEESLVVEEPAGIFAFPGGAKAGILLHDIFEHLDFTQSDTSHMRELVADKLGEYGFELTWQETLCSMIRKVLSVPLDPHRTDLTLSRIKDQDRLNELGFYFPLKSEGVRPESMASVVKSVGLSRSGMERLYFAPARGFMRGFIDLVFQWRDRFYLVDWKSNLLGYQPKDYDQEGLSMAMKREFYVLQYHIYALALDQHLRVRMPGYSYEKNFGGVFYIFLRGVDPEMGPDFGIYRDLPSPELIRVLREELIEHFETASNGDCIL